MTHEHSPHALQTFMRQITEEIASEYERIHQQAAGDPGTAGDEGEENWATVFREWLAPQYHVATKGRLISATGKLSPQVDVLVLKPSYPKKLLEKKIWLADGVVAVFECKTTLTAAHIRDSFARCREFKSLAMKRSGDPRSELRSPLYYGLLAHSHSWKSPNSKPVQNIAKAVEDAAVSLEHPRDEVDAICVADLGLWYSMYISKYEASWVGEAKKDVLEKIFDGSWGPQTVYATTLTTEKDQKVDFQPIGGLIARVSEHMAWEDSSIRNIVEYYRRAKIWGNGGGIMRPWPQSVYSEAVIQKLPSHLVNGEQWNRWSIHG